MLRTVHIRCHAGVGIFSSKVCILLPQNPEVEWSTKADSTRASQSLSLLSDYIETPVFAKPKHGRQTEFQIEIRRRELTPTSVRLFERDSCQRREQYNTDGQPTAIMNRFRNFRSEITQPFRNHLLDKNVKGTRESGELSTLRAQFALKSAASRHYPSTQ